MNSKPRAEFEQRMKVKMIIESIIKTLLKSKIIHSFELIYSYDLVSGITSLETRKPSFSWRRQIFGFKKMFLFLSGNVLVFLPMPYVNFRKM